MTNYNAIFSGKNGSKTPSTIEVMQNAIETDLTFDCYFEDGSAYTFAVGDVVTGSYLDNATPTDVYGIAGTITPTEAGSTMSWARDAVDVGTPGEYTLSFKVVSSGEDPDYSLLMTYRVIAVPDGVAVPASPLVGVSPADAAWLALAAATLPDASDLASIADLDSGLTVLESALIPVAIADMTATANGSDAVDLAWTYTAVAYIAGFKVYRKTGLAGTYALVDTIAITETSYADSGLDVSTEYYYRVDAYNNFFTTVGNEANATTVAAQLVDLLLALPGVVGVWPADETSGTTIVEAGGNTSLDGTYAGSIPLNSIPYPTAVGGASPHFQDSDDDMQMFTAALANGWSWEKGWFLLLYKSDAGNGNQLVSIVNNTSSPTLRLQSPNYPTAPNGYVQISGVTGSLLVAYYQRYDRDWTLIGARWDTTRGVSNYIHQGALYTSADYTGATDAPLSDIKVGKAVGFRGGVGYIAFGAGDIPSATEIDALYSAIYPTTGKSIFVCGDSWATENDYWIDTIVGDLRTADGNHWREAPYRIGYSGQRVAYINSQLAIDLPATAGTPDYILYAGSANDITGGTLEAAFKSDFEGIIDTLQAKWPGVPIYMHSPYRDDAYDGSYDAASLNIRQWQADVIATKTNVFAGPDGNVWFKTNIDTWSSDRVHPTEDAGRIECAAQWLAALGY